MTAATHLVRQPSRDESPKRGLPQHELINLANNLASPVIKQNGRNETFPKVPQAAVIPFKRLVPPLSLQGVDNLGARGLNLTERTKSSFDDLRTKISKLSERNEENEGALNGIINRIILSDDDGDEGDYDEGDYDEGDSDAINSLSESFHTSEANSPVASPLPDFTKQVTPPLSLEIEIKPIPSHSSTNRLHMSSTNSPRLSLSDGDNHSPYAPSSASRHSQPFETLMQLNLQSECNSPSHANKDSSPQALRKTRRVIHLTSSRSLFTSCLAIVAFIISIGIFGFGLRNIFYGSRIVGYTTLVIGILALLGSGYNLYKKCSAPHFRQYRRYES